MKRAETVAQQILRYLGEHPEACDTLEGVVRWWVLSQQLSESVELVREALVQLEAEGAIREQAAADGRILYRALAEGQSREDSATAAGVARDS